MERYKKCEVCRQYHWSDKQCLPEYFVYHEEYLGNEPKSIRASNHEDAALRYAQYFNLSNDHILLNDYIQVRVQRDDKVKFFEVSAEPDVHYSSKEVSE
jgi:hypothetical protein